MSGVHNLDTSFWYQIQVPVSWTENSGRMPSALDNDDDVVMQTDESLGAGTDIMHINKLC